MGLFGSGRRPVVGGVVLSRDGATFLAAQRSYPPALAGRWELPGGKSEPRERPQDTLKRELMEELGIRVNVLQKLSGSVNVPNSELKLQVWSAQLISGTPRLIEGHRQVRWLTVDELWSVNWLDSNKSFVRQIPNLLT
jgi:ADP-ribose pyrophosphatase